MANLELLRKWLFDLPTADALVPNKNFGKSSKLIGGTRKSGSTLFRSISQLLLVIKVSKSMIYGAVEWGEVQRLREHKKLAINRAAARARKHFLWREISLCMKRFISAPATGYLWSSKTLLLALGFVESIESQQNVSMSSSRRSLNFSDTFRTPLSHCTSWR